MMSLLSLLFVLIGMATAVLIGLIPIIGALIAAVFLPLLTTYLAGAGFCDPAMERRGIGIGGSFTFAWRNRGRVLGHGLGFTILLLIPVAGWFLAPSYGVVAGTMGAVAILGPVAAGADQ
jgi:CysZ protein